MILDDRMETSELSIQNHFHLGDYLKIKLTTESEGKSFQLRKIKFYLLLGEKVYVELSRRGKLFQADFPVIGSNLS